MHQWKCPIICLFYRIAYQPLKLMQTVIAKINAVCQRLLDNSQLDMIPAPPPAQKAPPRYAVSAIKNYRRKMEDRHVVIDDFNGVFGIEVSNGNAILNSIYILYIFLYFLIERGTGKLLCGF